MTESLATRIAASGPIPFPEFMAAALYDPLRGYYARESRQVGRDGDFFTSVSVGAVFGSLLARRFLEWWTAAGKPAEWRVIELGAHDGTLAEDILTALRELDRGALESLEYAIIEPLPALATAQRKRLFRFSETLTFATTLEELDARPGLAFGNELLDALPFHVIEWHQDDWSECHVGWADGAFKWCPGQSLSSELSDAVKSLIGPFPEGYRSEVRSGFPELLDSLARSLGTGMVIWIDYGFARPDYYAPARSTGTLRTYSKHQAGEDPLTVPGECDITAHVDFTHLAEAALAHGLIPTCFSSQGSWLTRLAAPWLREMESRPDSAAIRQFQTLTHPSHLGARFHVLEMALNEPVDPVAAADTLQRLALTGNIRP